MYICTYSKDALGRYVAANNRTLEVAGLGLLDFLGRTDWDLPHQAAHASVWVEHDVYMRKTQATESFYEPIYFQNEVRWLRTMKSPLFAHTGKIIGITGIGIFVSSKAMIPLSAQQQACLKLLGLGHTHKQIGVELGLSHKTVEHYIENIKNKLNCESRSELVQQAIERGLVGFI